MKLFIAGALSLISSSLLAASTVRSNNCDIHLQLSIHGEEETRIIGAEIRKIVTQRGYRVIDGSQLVDQAGNTKKNAETFSISVEHLLGGGQNQYQLGEMPYNKMSRKQTALYEKYLNSFVSIMHAPEGTNGFMVDFMLSKSDRKGSLLFPEILTWKTEIAKASKDSSSIITKMVKALVPNCQIK